MNYYLPNYLEHTTKVLLFILLCSGCNPDENLPITKDTWEKFTTKQNLPSNFITTLFEDNKGRIWVGTSSGVAIFENGEFTIETELSGNLINAISQDANGDMWIGYDNGIFYQDGNTWLTLNYFEGAKITSIIKGYTNDMWVGTYGYGVIQYDWSEQQFNQTTDPDCIDCNYVNVIHEDAQGVIWVGTGGDLKKLFNNTWSSYTVEDGLPGESITSLTHDGWGNLWIGSFDGTTLSKFNYGSFQTVEIGNGATQNWIYSIEEDKNGIMWISTVAKGLLNYDGAVMVRVTDDLPGLTFTSLLSDSHGNMLIGTFENGLIYYPIK